MPPRTAPLKKRILFSIVFALWNWNFTPQGLIRFSGSFFGRKIARKFVETRFLSYGSTDHEVSTKQEHHFEFLRQIHHTSQIHPPLPSILSALSYLTCALKRWNDEQRLGEYMYTVSKPPASGEYAINHILEPGAWARRPLETRLTDLTIPVTFLYGDKDWMSWY